MKQFYTLNKSIVWSFLSISALLTSCDKKDGYLVSKPELIEEPANNGIDTITLGDSLLLHPKINKTDPISYRWLVNGETVSSDSVFTFIPSDRGNANISFTAENESGEVTLQYKIHTWGKYENGFFIVNEGWFGHGTGTLSFYRYNTGVLEDSLFTRENPDKNLEPASSTLQFGTIFNHQLYLVSKARGPVVVTDAYSMKELKRIPAQSGHDWRAFIGLDQERGLLSSTDGIYQVNLETMTVGEAVNGISGQVGDMVKVGNYIFAISQKDGLVIFDVQTNEIKTKVSGMQVGFGVTDDGAVWTAGAKNLVKIDPHTLAVTEIVLPFAINGSWGAWHPGTICASANSVFLAKNSAWTTGKEIYRYDGTETSLDKAFIELPNEKVMYGAGLAYDKKFNQVVVSTVKDGWGESYSANKLYFFDASSGLEKNSYNYDGYYFPSISVFH